MHSFTRTRATAASAAFAFAIATACSSDDEVPPPLPEGPPRFGIRSIEAAGRVVPVTGGSSGACFAVGNTSTRSGCSTPVSGSACGFAVVLRTDTSGRIPLDLPDGSQPRFWQFEPPLGCGGAPDCGFALLLVAPTSPPCAPKPQAALQVIAAGPSISVSFDELRRSLNGVFGRTDIRVELWPAEGAPDAGGSPPNCHATTATVDFEPICGEADGGPNDGGRTDAGPRDGAADGAEAGPHDASSESNDAQTPTPDASVDARVDATGTGGAPNDASDGKAGSGGAQTDASGVSDATTSKDATAETG